MEPASRLHDHADQIFRAALVAADPEEAIRRALRLRGDLITIGRTRVPLRRFRRILVLGAGKAAANMARALEQLLGDRLGGGLVVVKYGHGVPLRRVEIAESAHPVPDEAGVAGAARIAEIAQSAGEDTLIFCVVSGGASAILPAPAEPVTLAEKQQVTRGLLQAGADISELNTVRKHLSSLKGGQLARLAAPAQVVTLLLSDVIGDRLDVIGSGPTAPDLSRFEDARAVLDRFGLWADAPESVRRRIERGCSGEIAETPKPGDESFRRVSNHVIGSNRSAVVAAAAEARALGYRAMILSTSVDGETREAARMHAAILRECRESGNPLRKPACFLSGGETTVTVRGDGLGGRNLEFVLAAAIALDGTPDVAVFSGGTDGTDGPTDAAGAVADGGTCARARAMGLDPLAFLGRNDSYRFFDQAGGLAKTGPTGTNVMDIRILIAG